MANMNLKKDFVDDEKLPAKDLNNNFAVIEECINNTEKALSAYELAKESGFEGTEEEYLASLVGPQGPQGVEGRQGFPSMIKGYTLFWTELLLSAQGYNVNIPISRISLTNLEVQILQNDTLSYLNVNVEDANSITLNGNILCMEPYEGVKANFIEYVVEVYNEDMSTLLKTYKVPYEIKSSRDYHDITLFIDTSSLDSINIVFKGNVLKHDNILVSEASLYIESAMFLLEEFI